LSNHHPFFQIWDATDSKDTERWLVSWKSWQQREVYAHPNYVNLYVDGQKNRAFCAAWDAPDAHVLYPFIVRDLTLEPYWSPEIGPAADIITPYGYGGPYVWGDGDRQTATVDFWASFNQWAIQHNIVSEFIRFALFKDTVLAYPGKCEEKQQNIIRTLELEADQIWMEFKHKVRKNVNRARQKGVRIELDAAGEKLDDFFRLYTHTMKRRDAKEGYYFPRAYFEQIHQTLPGQFMYFHAVQDQAIISTELVLVSANHIYSFLGGTDVNSFDLRPNDLLKYEIILWAKENGKQHFILGGGYEPDDGIYQYKAAFAPNGEMPFTVGHRILRSDIYDKLIDNRINLARNQGHEWFPNANYFPGYRA
jgi:Acetyltransferase (GNAT) domain